MSCWLITDTLSISNLLECERMTTYKYLMSIRLLYSHLVTICIIRKTEK